MKVDEHLNLRPNQWGYCSEGCPVEEGKEYEMKMIMVKIRNIYFMSDLIFFWNFSMQYNNVILISNTSCLDR